MITYHPSADGGRDYLDFHTPDDARIYLPRHEMRALLAGLLAAVGDDVACEHCGRLNGVHRIWVDAGGDIQRCEGAQAGQGTDMTQLDELVQDGQLSIDAARVSLGLQPLGLPETSVPSKRDAPRLDVALTVADTEPCVGAGAAPRPEAPDSPYKDLGLSSLWELRADGREYIDGVPVWLTANDPEPPPGTTIEMEDGQRWTRYEGMSPGSWLVEGGEADSDPETWLKVAGNYGPVRIVRPAPCVPVCPVPLSPREDWSCPTCRTKWRVS